MISTSGRYWSPGITVTYHRRADLVGEEVYDGWHARVDYHDDAVLWSDTDPDAGHVSTRGTLETSYAVRNTKTRSGLSIAVDTLLADAEKLGIEFLATEPDTEPRLVYGDNAEYPPPDGWRRMLAAEAERIGFLVYAAP